MPPPLFKIEVKPKTVDVRCLRPSIDLQRERERGKEVEGDLSWGLWDKLHKQKKHNRRNKSCRDTTNLELMQQYRLLN